MRNMIVAVCLVLLATAAVAQEKPTAVYVFLTNPGVTHSDHTGTRWEGAFGVALQRMFTPRLSAEVAVSQESKTAGFVSFNPDGTVREDRVFTETTLPVDLTARYHFFTHGSWKPYAGLGVRYVDRRTFGDLTGGVVWQFRPALGLRFDAKVLVGGDSRFNDQVNGSVGLSWRF
jgi:outer membrane protein W